MCTTLWKAIDTNGADYIGEIEFQSPDGEWHHFTVLSIRNFLVFGGATNNTFLESGHIKIENGESRDDCLAELQSDLESYYSDGAQYAARIVCNKRM